MAPDDKVFRCQNSECLKVNFVCSDSFLVLVFVVLSLLDVFHVRRRAGIAREIGLSILESHVMKWRNRVMLNTG